MPESTKILTKLCDSVVDRNPAIRQQCLERQMVHFRKTARLRERQPFLLEQGQRELPLQLELADTSRRKHLV